MAMAGRAMTAPMGIAAITCSERTEMKLFGKGWGDLTREGNGIWLWYRRKTYGQRICYGILEFLKQGNSLKKD